MFILLAFVFGEIYLFFKSRILLVKYLIKTPSLKKTFPAKIFCQSVFINPIINGEDADIEHHPWMVSLGVRKFGHICGGAIIDEYKILTAAQCILTRKPSELYIRVGSASRTIGGAILVVREIIIHHGYENFFDNDIAILILDNQLEFSKNVQSIALPTKTDDLTANTPVEVAGWGITEIGKLPDKLRVVDLTIVSQGICVKAYQTLGVEVVPNMICAGVSRFGEQGVCNVRLNNVIRKHDV